MSKGKYQLNAGVTIFYDDESDLKVVAGQTVELDEDTVTAKTKTALMSGAFVKVRAEKAEGKNQSQVKADDSDLPEDLPGRDAFVAAGLNFGQVKNLKEEELLAIKGVGAGTVKALVDYAKAQAPKD